MLNITLSRVYQFSAAHRLDSPYLDAGENFTIYDKCNNLNGHGHDYTLEVTVKGKPDVRTGMILPLPKLDKAVEQVLHTMDHKHLNMEVAFFKDTIPTAEHIIQFLWTELQKKLPQDCLYYLRLWETNNNFFEIGKEI